MKNADWRTLRDAIRNVLGGQLYFEPGVTQSASQSAGPRQRKGRNGGNLTQRQREVLQMLAEGRGAKEVADVLGISARTVEFHKYRIMETLAVRG